MVIKSLAEHKNIPPTVADSKKFKNSATVMPERSIYSVEIKIQRADDKVRINRKMIEKELISRLPKKLTIEIWFH
jgi:hypothetical protein